jgi:hypothetical protein
MTLEIQKLLEGTSRSAVGTGVELDLVLGENGVNIDPDFLEMIYRKKSDGTFLHFPSEEKLVSESKAVKSGAQFIGVDATDLAALPGGDLQSVLEAIDVALLGGGGINGIILEDGTVPMLEKWRLHNGFSSASTVHINPYVNPTVASGGNSISGDRLVSMSQNNGMSISDTYAEGSNVLDNLGLDSPASEWSAGGDGALAGGLFTVTYSSGSATLTQTDANMLSPKLISNRPYVLTIRPQDISSMGSYKFRVKFGSEIISKFIEASDLVQGTANFISCFHTTNGSPTDIAEGEDFVLEVSSGGVGDSFSLTEVSLSLLGEGDVFNARLKSPKIEGMKRKVVDTFISRSVAYDDNVIVARGSGTTITLPEVKLQHEGVTYIVKNGSTGANTTVATFGAELIDGGVTDTLTANYDYAEYTLIEDFNTLRWAITSKG